MTSEAPRPAGALAPGTRLGPYEVLASLAAGGMGEVFRARDTRLGREVAIKILPGAFALEPDRLRRFEQEARAVSALSHPNILTIHDVGTHEGKPYLVCELLQGRTLREMLQGSPLPVAALVSWGSQLAAGLAAAHAKGIVHRDLKPENVFLTDDDRVKILDFGLAKLRRLPEDFSEGEPLSATTETGMVLGTMGYMSPEQASGEHVDQRTDIFSLGVLLYEMATGRPAFPGYSLAALAAVVNSHPPRVSSVRPDFPGSLETVIERCLSKHPDGRFQSAAELARALETGLPGSAAGAGTATTRWRRVALGMAAVLLAALIILSVRGRGLRSGGLPALAVAVLPFVALQGAEGYLAEGVTDGIIVDLSQIGSLKVLAFQDTARQLAELRREHGVQAVVQGTIARAGDSVSVAARLVQAGTGRVLWEGSFATTLGQLPERQGVMAVAISNAARAVVRRDERDRLTARHEVDRRAYEGYLRGNFALDQGDLELARSHFERAASLDPQWAPPHVGLAKYWTSLSFFSDLPPAEVLPRARDAVTHALELDSTLAEAHAVLGYLRAYYEWDWRAAEQEFRRALALQPSNAQAYFSYSRFLASRGRFEEAMTQIQRAVEFDPLSLELRTNVALLHYFAERYAEAAASLEETRRLNPEYVLAGWGLGLVYEQQRRLPEAIAILEAVAGRSLNRLSSLGHTYGLAGRIADARAILDTLTTRSQSAYVPAYWFALVHAGLGDADETLRWLDRAYQERSTILAYLRIDPRLRPLRDHPRFVALASRMAGD